jgi:hypothetical protein
MTRVLGVQKRNPNFLYAGFNGQTRFSLLRSVQTDSGTRGLFPWGKAAEASN